MHALSPFGFSNLCKDWSFKKFVTNVTANLNQKSEGTRLWKNSAFFLSNISNARIYSVHSVKIVTTVLHISLSCQPHILDPPNVFPILRTEATLWPRWGKNLEIWSKCAKVATLAFNSSKDFFLQPISTPFHTNFSSISMKVPR